ncbi:hypothetical protein HOU02_gp109 [Caulobacter phage CcrBL9]|uniref:Uncharacterized protein n=1 Tax=Caulobacter phage CcrBL9 TaxID=2283270 RepID=A0A385EBG5_9CAUD|nr:hypothetical protein HOU02_gp109 [Caulobacter phage CcrBL9]AXQ69133.1 hypothetical protein CcrBL9_gp109 [Caulobacter phage CcrBL9]
MPSCIVVSPKVKEGQPAPKLKAYTVLEQDEYTGGIVFAAHHAVARRAGANEWGDGEWEYVECRRSPEYDAYGPEGLNDLILWRNGWHFECMCGRRIDSDFGWQNADMVWSTKYGEFIDREHKTKRLYCAPVLKEPVLHGRHLYCSPWCAMNRRNWQAERERDGDLAMTMARLSGTLEGCEIINGAKRTESVATGKTITWDFMGHPRTRPETKDVATYHVAFRFPGGQYPGDWKHTDPTKVYLSRVDVEAWCKFKGKPFDAELYG